MEVHNFHIHQLKFTVTRDEYGQPVMRTPSAVDRVLLPSALVLDSKDESGNLAELQHDTIIVPRGVSQCADSLSYVTSVSMDGTVASADMLPLNMREHAVHAFKLAATGAAEPNCDTKGTGDGSGMIGINMDFSSLMAQCQDDCRRRRPVCTVRISLPHPRT
ncbi:MAG: hypothetical protein R3C97_09270 [Geminicoccaceae bacterium]